jgi:heptosyltransferase-1
MAAMAASGQLTITPQNVLIIKPSAIGDVVHALPILGLMRRKWPRAKISWLVTPACAGLLEDHPLLNQVIRFERRRFGRGWRDPEAAMGLWKFARQLKLSRFDLVVDLQGLFRSGWLAGRTKAAHRVGFSNAREFGWIYYNHRVAVRSNETHAIERYLDVAEALGLGRGPVEFMFPDTAAESAYVDSIVRPLGKFAVVFPGTNWETKRWPVEQFATLARQLKSRFGLASIAAGSTEEFGLCKHVGANLNLAGRTSLKQLIALLQRAAIVIANDSGPMHIAAALSRPLVTLFGPTNPVRTGPYGRDDSVLRLEIPCSPCYSRRCSHRSCLRLLEVESALSAVKQQLYTAAHELHQ